MTNIFDYNTKDRLVVCLICKHEEVTKEPGPKCPKCNCSMITVLSSVITGERITGVKE